VPSTLSPNYKKQYALTLPIKLSAALSIFGFINWETLLSIEVRYNFAYLLLNGFPGCGSLFIFLVLTFIKVLNKDNWYSALAVLLFPVAIAIVTFMTFLSTIPTPEWNDVIIYKHKSQYLILECNYGWAFTDVSYRYIVTCSTNKKIRLIQHLKYLVHYPKNSDSRFIPFNGLTWKKVNFGI
jgi:hypothetical protein